MGELDNTIIVMTGDHGMPFPRCKSNLYDMGVRVPLAIRWGKNIEPATVNAFVSLTDLAPTFLELAGVDIPKEFTGKSLVPFFKKEGHDEIKPVRDYVVFGKERHVPAQLSPSMQGYPSRAIRTQDYLYIYNYDSERWPAGVPDQATHPSNSFADCDNGPTKSFLIENRDQYLNFYELSFAKRPTEELYQISTDPYQINNLAYLPGYHKTKEKLHQQLVKELMATEDPRERGRGDEFDQYPYRAPYMLNVEGGN